MIDGTLRGADLARAILGLLDKKPELHNQYVWGLVSIDGVRACIGGWALIVTGKAEWSFIPDEHGPGVEIMTGGRFAKRAADLLELDLSEAEKMFFCVDLEVSMELLRQVASGKKKLDKLAAIDALTPYNRRNMVGV